MTEPTKEWGGIATVAVMAAVTAASDIAAYGALLALPVVWVIGTALERARRFSASLMGLFIVILCAITAWEIVRLLW